MKTIAAASMVVSLAFACPAETQGERAVFAHYMACFMPDEGTARKEIAVARLYGIDGWALNCGEWQRKNGDTWDDTGYVGGCANIFKAAEGTDFKLFFSPDGGEDGFIWGNQQDMGFRYHDHPNLFRYGGRPLISGWNAGLRTYDKYPLLKRLLTEGGCGDYLIVPSYNCTGFAQFEPYDFYESDIYHNPKFVCDGVFFFGSDNTIDEIVSRLEIGRRAALKNGKLFMAGFPAAYNSANLRDYRGMEGFCTFWKTVVETQPELVELVTWNDNAEDSGIFASGWTGNAIPNDLENRPWMCRDESFLDLTAYFAAAYKSRGIYPAIVQDKLYTAYRTRPKSMTRTFRAEFEGWVDARDRYLQVHGDVEDRVYATVMLTAPAAVSVCGASTELPAGIHHLSAPMRPGTTPEFSVTRGGREVLRTVGRRQIASVETERNSLCYDWNGVHRMWTQCAVAGARVLTLEAAGGTEWKLPADFKPGSYCFRVRYANGTDEEARFTFCVDSAARGRRHLMPLYLPPTGGAEKELAFLWSVPEGSTGIRIAVEKDTRAQKKYDFSDWGGADIKSVSLVANRVARFDGSVKSAKPELVAVPGGTFKGGKVAISPFSIGRFEVTNRQYEEFRPEHRSLRSEAAWRDDDPVVFVSWRDAAAYCNWLSKKEGLAPAYDEANEMAWVRGANGYRLPTEAEWEYVASGRGEDRVYPWGSEPHAKTRGWAHPAGADASDVSRDGVFDMGGNVSEWCSDSFHFDTVIEGKDPLCTKPPACPRVAYRSIRGGSFGYYGSPRCADRDYNSPGYSGYVYIGFRIAR